MPMMFCPECKQLIPVGALRGSSTRCSACSRRTDPSDLIVMNDDGDVIAGNAPNIVASPAKQAKPVYKSMWDDESESFALNQAQSTTTAFERSLECFKGEVGDVVYEERFIKEMPYPCSVDFIQLPSLWKWDRSSRTPTIFKKDEICLPLVALGCIILICSLSCFCSPVITVVQYSWAYLNDDLITFFFLGAFGTIVGVASLIFGLLLSNRKTWIEFSRDHFVISHGLNKTNEPCIVFRRNPQHIFLQITNESYVSDYHKYDVVLYDRYNPSIKYEFASFVGAKEVTQWLVFVKALVVANID